MCSTVVTDDDLIGMVVNAIMAGTEPKMCSANLLKKYVMEWFSEKFKLVDRPHLFKKALERAVANNEIRFVLVDCVRK